MSTQSYGVDTSVLLRLLTGDPEDQASVAIKFVMDSLAEGQRVLVSDLVVSETFHALYYHYGIPKRVAVRQLLAQLESGWFTLEPKGCALAALKDAAAPRPGFVDRLIRHQYLVYADGVASFDKTFGKLDRVRVLA